MADKIREALEELTAACERDFCSEDTEGGFGRCGDDESVAGGDRGDCKITFGMIRRARKALDTAK